MSLHPLLKLVVGWTVIGRTLAYTWPNPVTDELERLLYEQGGRGLNSPSFGVTDCARLDDDGGPLIGRTNSAEWFRNAYHDMATANVAEGTGGIDASIGFEYFRAENPGRAFEESLNFFVPFQSMRASMADLIAMGATLALGSCSNGTVFVPYRGGRVDATGPGPAGVPEPQQDIDSHTKSFVSQGFNITEMVGLVACGHTLGGVHGSDFPTIVPVTKNTTEDDNRQDFDDTFALFDNRVAVQFVNNQPQNPLAFGQNTTTNSDARIFRADGGVMIGKMAESNDFFLETCTTLLERMLNTVPATVKLTDVITPLAVKPSELSIQINASDATMSITGFVRVANDDRTTRQRQVFVDITPRDPSACPITATAPCTYSAQGVRQSGSDSFTPIYAGIPSFIVYKFTATVPASVGISSFVVRLEDGGNTITETNNDQGFPFPDVLLPQLSNSCTGRGTNSTLNVTVATRDDAHISDVVLSIPWPTAQDGSPVPRFDIQNVTMVKTKVLDGTGYSLWNGVFSNTSSNYTSLMKLYYDVQATGPIGAFSNEFNLWQDIGGPGCASL